VPGERPALGLVLPLADRAGSAREFVRDLVEEVAAADAAGFDVCLVPEHHKARATSIVAPLTLCAALAQATFRIKIGTGILVLPAHHPRHVAEQVTMIDQISNGRAVLGVGAGYQADDLEPFGVSLAERGRVFEEALGEVGRLLGPDGVSPAPVQRPRPPIWIGSWAPVGIRRAAQLADGWIADPIRTVAEIGLMADTYRRTCTGDPGTVVVMREAWVDEQPGAEERFARVITPIFDYYRRKQAAQIPETFEAFAEDRFVVGTAEGCADQVAAIGSRTGADIVALTLRHPAGPGHAAVMSGIEALGSAWAGRMVAA
jgi:alkanesulfonate monooxygenase SsuD/methylene tetrahydromethanopterin reductase-like flavin-dependent oxidoreductase (luciferase family)